MPENGMNIKSEMGFATHMRFHWMEPVLYKSILYIPLAVTGGFNAHSVPNDGRDNELGFIGDKEVPDSFLAQEIYPLKL